MDFSKKGDGTKKFSGPLTRALMTGTGHSLSDIVSDGSRRMGRVREELSAGSKATMPAGELGKVEAPPEWADTQYPTIYEPVPLRHGGS